MSRAVGWVVMVGSGLIDDATIHALNDLPAARRMPEPHRARWQPALKTLPRYAGQVKCIYIDPPFSSAAGWVYQRQRQQPEIRQWLGEVNGRQKSETLVGMIAGYALMYPRLVLLSSFCGTTAQFLYRWMTTKVGPLRLCWTRFWFEKLR